MSPSDIRRLAAESGPNSVLRELAAKLPRAKSRDLEHIEQVKLFEWAQENVDTWPELRKMFAIPNFTGRMGNNAPAAAKRHGAKLKAEGRKRGVPDICLPVARGGFHGLFIELKSLEGSATVEQLVWQTDLRAEGYRAEIIRGFEAARDLIVDYLSQ